VRYEDRHKKMVDHAEKASELLDKLEETIASQLAGESFIGSDMDDSVRFVVSLAQAHAATALALKETMT
jgi:hypothetical protein